MKILAAPLIGALIGYCTNFIAVKMLFRPLNPVKIGKFTVPFTPGIIPKRKPALARAIGQTVGKSLVGEEEIKAILASDKMKAAVVTNITGVIEEAMQESNIKDLASLAMEAEAYEKKKNAAVDYVSERIVDGLKSIDITELIITEGTAAVTQMGGMIAMFVNESMVASLAGPIGSKVENYIATNGKELIQTKVEEEVLNLEEKPIGELLGMENLDGIAHLLGDMYEAILENAASDIVNAFDICGIVENKINEMDVRELEQLIMSVMKHELAVIVNLGALIGFVLGLFNLFF